MDQVSTDKLMNDLRTVVADAEALLRATAGQAGEKMTEVRARAEESLRTARASLEHAGADVAARARAGRRRCRRVRARKPVGLRRHRRRSRIPDRLPDRPTLKLMADQTQPGGLFASLKALLATLIAIGHNRLELFSTELQEEIARAASMLLWALGGACCSALLAVLLAVGAILLAVPEESRAAGCGADRAGRVGCGGGRSARQP